MKRNELYFEVPNFGEVLLEPIVYGNGREGYLVITPKEPGSDDTRGLNLTINPIDKPHDPILDKGQMYLKDYDEVQVITRHLLNKTDMFIKLGEFQVGYSKAILVMLKQEYYEMAN